MSHEEKIQALEQDIAALNEKLAERKAALPMHDATPQQWIAIEELEDAVALKKKELKALTANSPTAIG